MGSQFSSMSRRLFGRTAPSPRTNTVGKPLVQLEERTVPATFIVTNILDNQFDVVGGLSLRQAILAANSNPGFDRIEFNIPRSPSLPTLPGNPNENYFPIVLATTLPDLSDPSGVAIDATTQPRQAVTTTQPIVQLLPDPNPGAFPGNRGALFVTSPYNLIRGFVITGFPGAAINLTSAQAHDNIMIGNWLNTDISGTKPWNEDPYLTKGRPPGTPVELTNAGPNPNQNPKFVLAGITFSLGAHDNTVGGIHDANGATLVDAGGRLVGEGGVVVRYNNANPPAGSIPVTPDINRNVISGTPEFRKDYFSYAGGKRDRGVTGNGVGAGIRFMSNGTSHNLVQGNYIGTDISGTQAIPNYNGIEIFAGASSNYIGSPDTHFIGDPVLAGVGNLIRFNQFDGIRVANTPNPSQIDPPTIGITPEPFTEAYESETTTPGGSNLANVNGDAPNGFGPVVGNVDAAVFYDAFNPYYFIGGSPASAEIGGDIISMLATDPANPAAALGFEGVVGQVVRLTGTAMLSTTAVNFTTTTKGLVVNAPFHVISDNEVDVTIPLGAGPAPGKSAATLTLFTPSGKQQLSDFFIDPSAPAQIDKVAAFSPSSGTIGSLVTITGTGFQGTSSVAFGGILSTKYSVLGGGTKLQVYVPQGAQSGSITITTPSGAVDSLDPNTGLGRAFVVKTQPPPQVISLSTTSGLPGQVVTLTGIGFTSAYLLRFNHAGGLTGFATSNFTVDSDTQITAVIPPSATVSTNAIQVVADGGTSDATGGSPLFTILTPPVPTISGLDLTSGPIGTQITITGANFAGARTVKIGGLDAKTFTAVSDNVIIAVVPLGVLLNTASAVTVTNSGGTGTSPVSFTVTPSLAPTVNPVAVALRNTYAIITGTHLLGTTKVLFGSATVGVPASAFDVLSDTQLRVLIPLAAASGKYFVFTPYNFQNPVAQPASNTIVISNVAPPTIDQARQLDPIAGVIGQEITIHGTGFLSVQDVLFTAPGNTTISGRDIVIDNDNTIRVKVPLTTITGPVTLVGPGNPDTDTPFTAADPVGVSAPLTILTSPVPKIVSAFPLTGPAGTVVTITGTGFTGALAVTFNGVPADDYTILNDSQIRARVPLLASTGLVAVSTVGGSGPSASAFTVTASPQPTVNYSSPAAARNQTLSISGSGLASTTRIVFNDVPAKFRIISDSLVEATVPLSASPGLITITTAGGSAVSPTAFTLIAADPPGPLSEFTPDALAVGGKFALNGNQMSGVFRVELKPRGAAVGTSAKFSIISANEIDITVPEVDSGVVYDVITYASSTLATDAGTNAAEPANIFGATNTNNSSRNATDILGNVTDYGEQVRVIANPRPVVTGVTALNGGNFLRGSPIAITGTGLLGTNAITVDGTAVDPNFITVISDQEVDCFLPVDDIGDGVSADKGAVVKVFTPNGVVGDPADDLVSIETGTKAQINIPATDALTFTVPDSATAYGDTITLTATSGTFFGVTSITMNAIDGYTGTNLAPNGAQPAPEFRPFGTVIFQNFQVGVGGTTATAVIPTNFRKIPDPMPAPQPPNAPPAPPTVPTAIVCTFAATPLGSVMGIGTVPADPQLLPVPCTLVGRFDAPTVDSVQGGNIYNTGITLQSGTLDIMSTNTIDFGGGVVLGRQNILFHIVNGVPTIDTLRPSFRSPLAPQVTTNTPSTGAGLTLTIAGYSVTATGTSNNPQQLPFAFLYEANPNAPLDNRFFSNLIYGNGLTIQRDANLLFTGTTPMTQAELRTNGVLGIDFVTTDPNAGDTFLGTFPFAYAYALQAQNNTPITGVIAHANGNEGRGGVDDGYANSFSLTPGPSNFNGATSKNTFNNVVQGRFYGPNNLQNFPLLQAVQSTADRTTFSTALIAKPFRSYRIDYFYDPGFDSDQDATALATTNAGYAQILLGSKIISTDFQGNGSVNFIIYKKFATDPNGLTQQPGEFVLPNNTPLPVGQNQGVVVTTATDLTAEGPDGATVTNGGDGSSRFSFFKRIDTSTGEISGKVQFDANGDGIISGNETGLDKTIVQLYIDRGDGTLSTSPVLTVTTDKSGAYDFGPASTADGTALPNGTHRVVVTLPGGTSYVFTTPNGTNQKTVQIINGEIVPNVNFIFKKAPTTVNNGDIAGTVFFDANGDGTVGLGEGGLAGATVQLFNDTNGKASSPFLSIVTNATGTYDFANANGASLSNGTYRVKVVPPAGSTSVFTTPSNSDTQTITIAGGLGIVGVNFVLAPAGTSPPVTTPPPPPAGQTNLVKLLAVGSDAGRSSVVNVYNADGSFRYSFAPYGDSYTGGVRVAVGDVTGDGNADIITAPGTGTAGVVKVYSGVTGSYVTQFVPYGDQFRGGVYVTTGDVDGDKIADIITGTGKGGGPRVTVRRGGTTAGVMNLETIADFFPYESNFRGGVLVAAGDVNGDGRADIVTGTGIGGGPRVKVIDAATLTPLYDFFAYANRFRGGVFASVGDVDGDGKPEILTGTGNGGGPVVKVFKLTDLVPGNPEPIAGKSFFAYDPNFRGGVRVDVLDGNSDGKLDIVTSPGPGLTSDIRVINFGSIQDIYRLQAYEASFRGGVFVGGTTKTS